MNVREGRQFLGGKAQAFHVTAEAEEIPCDHDTDCGRVHRRLTGRKWVTFEAGGHRFTADIVPGTERWEEVVPV